MIELWSSPSDADASQRRWHEEPATLAFLGLVDEATVSTQRFESLD